MHLKQERKCSKLKINIELAVGFFRVGILGFGGGPSSIPLIYTESVKRYHWIEEEDFSDILALGNMLPGPIATKMAGYIGYRVSGLVGCFTAIVFSVIPTVIMMIIFLSWLFSNKNHSVVSNMTLAILPVITVLLFSITKDFFLKSISTLKWWQTLVIMGAVSIAIFILNIHPAFIITGMILYIIMGSAKRMRSS